MKKITTKANNQNSFESKFQLAQIKSLKEVKGGIIIQDLSGI